MTLTALAVAAIAAQAQGGASRTDAAASARDDRLAIAHRGIALIDPSGRNRRNLTDRPGWLDFSPTWSPDGRRIAFTRTTNNYRSFQIFVKPVAGGSARRLTNGRADEDPAWSPDGRLIAYMSARGLTVIRPNGSGKRRMAGLRDAGELDWSPDGSRIAFTKGRWVWIARRDGTRKRRIVRGGDSDWSPDGRKLAFMPPDGGVATIGVNGKGRRFLANGMLPAWSPDGARIAFQTWPDNNVFDTWVMDANGKNRRRVTRKGGYPAWRPLPR